MFKKKEINYFNSFLIISFFSLLTVIYFATTKDNSHKNKQNIHHMNRAKKRKKEEIQKNEPLTELAKKEKPKEEQQPEHQIEEKEEIQKNESLTELTKKEKQKEEYLEKQPEQQIEKKEESKKEEELKISEKDKTRFVVNYQKEEKKIINNQNEEEYIPVLDNYKIQISFWFIGCLFFYICLTSNPPQEYFCMHYQQFGKEIKNLFFNYWEMFYVTYPLLILLVFLSFGELMFSLVCLLACLINKKPCKKVFSIDHRFWYKSWKNSLWSILICLLFAFINNFLVPISQYFLGSFCFTTKEKEQIIAKILTPATVHKNYSFFKNFILFRKNNQK